MKKMKKMLAGLLALALMLAGLPMYGMEARAEEPSDFTYKVNEDGNSVTILNYMGDGGAVTIPSEIDGKSVTEIGPNAFSYCNSLVSVSIPDSVTSIGDYAFSGCFSLKKASIPNNVTSIGIRAFQICSSLTEINIPDSVTGIGDSAFSVCSSLTEINIPDSVTSIGQRAFSGCSSLAAITVAAGNTKYDSRENCNAIIEKEQNMLLLGCKNTKIPSSVTSIGENAFLSSSLTEISIPGSVTSIGEGAFYDCSSLTEINILSGVVSIGRYAFYGCSSLVSVRIPDSVTSIGQGVVEGCSSLAAITIAEGNITYDSRENCNAIIETASNTLLSGCKNTKIPFGVTSIGDSAFQQCSLTEIRIPDSVTSIGNRAFLRCSSLSSITISSNVKVIKFSAFEGCLSLTEIRIPGSVTSIEEATFMSCYNLASVSISPGVGSVGEDAFSNCRSLTEISIPGSVTSIGPYAFSNCKNLASVSISPGVESIGAAAFRDCSSLTEISIPGSVKNIGRGAVGYVTPHGDEVAIPDFVIHGESGSAAETYANENGLTFQAVSENDIRWADVALSQSSYTYDGQEKRPSVTVTLSGKTLVLDTDYTVSYSNNTNEGTAAVTVTGKGNYTGNATAYFTISMPGSIEEPDKIDIAKATVTLSPTSYTYDGTAKTPSVTVTLDGNPLTLNTDYTVSYSNNTNAGTASVTVEGKGNYTGSKKADFTIVKATGNSGENPDTSITCKNTVYRVTYGAKPFKINATSKGKLTFTSSSPRIAAVDKNTGKVTIKGTGVATITIKSDTNTVNVMVKVSPKKASLKTVKPVKGKKLTVKWAKDKKASGYQVQISTAKNFKKNMKQKNVTKTSYTFTKLKAGKKYYVRVRSYKKSGKETLYGAWSSKKQSGKIKK